MSMRLLGVFLSPFMLIVALAFTLSTEHVHTPWCGHHDFEYYE